MTLTSLAGHLAFALIACAFLVRDLFWLRCLSIGGSVAAILYNYYAPERPLWLVIWWNAAFALVNAVQIVIMVREHSRVKFSDEERDLHGTLFRHLSPVEFMKVLRVAHWAEQPPGIELIREGLAVESLLLIFSGEVEVAIGGRIVATLRDGRFLGEMSYVSGGAASATVRTTERTRLVVWPKDELQKLFARNPSLRFAFQAVLTADLSKKLQRDSVTNESSPRTAS